MVRVVSVPAKVLDHLLDLVADPLPGLDQGRVSIGQVARAEPAEGMKLEEQRPAADERLVIGAEAFRKACQ
jgi:hypothetical protein